uniref:Methionine aminopeptidase n=1 Tax=Heterosigma akashiwo TaxID=2829 RepID=A0A6V1URZ5_HETAK
MKTSLILLCLWLSLSSVFSFYAPSTKLIVPRESGIVLPLGKGFGEKPKKKGFKYTGTTVPGVISPKREVPDHIMKPPYADDGDPKSDRGGLFPWDIEVKTAEDIEAMRISGRIAREVLDIAGKAVKAGITTDEIDRIVHEACIERNAYPSPLNYHGFPKSVCTSLNEIICHGIPDSTVLKDGDILNIDVTVYHGGYHGDCSEMFCVGEPDAAAKDLVQVTYDAWQEAANFCKPGRPYKEIGGIIEDYVTKRGYTTVPDFCGHGIGKVFHCNPNVLHYKNNEPCGKMEPGHVFTIEPMICEGTARNVMWPDKWTAATADGKRTAQFEHTFLLTATGVEALTAKLPDSPKQFWEK